MCEEPSPCCYGLGAACMWGIDLRCRVAEKGPVLGTSLTARGRGLACWLGVGRLLRCLGCFLLVVDSLTALSSLLFFLTFFPFFYFLFFMVSVHFVVVEVDSSIMSCVPLG